MATSSYNTSTHSQPSILTHTTIKSQPTQPRPPSTLHRFTETKSQSQPMSSPPHSPPQLIHKLLVSSSDLKIQNLLCPIELVFAAQNPSAPLIPKAYDPSFMCAFQNISSHMYRASTPKSHKLKIRNRKRKNHNHKDSLNRIPKKRKKLQNRHKSGHNSDEIDMERAADIHNHRSHSEQDFFSFQPHLNVNSRPKRVRKHVSYKEIETNAPLPITYVEPKKRVKSKSPKAQKKVVMDSGPVVEMRWVQCDKCLKWRRIPTSVSDSELEGEWTCAMNRWDMNRNSCAAAEESYDLAEEQTLVVSNGRNQSHKEKKEEFYGKLQRFYERNEMDLKGLNVSQLEMAKIGHRFVDFLQLYLEVTKRGGYQKCIALNLFEQIFASLSCFQSDLAIGQAKLSLQNLYDTYLIHYERKYFNY